MQDDLSILKSRRSHSRQSSEQVLRLLHVVLYVEIFYKLKYMSCHNRPAKADMGVVIVLRNCLRIILASWGPVEPQLLPLGGNFGTNGFMC